MAPIAPRRILPPQPPPLQHFPRTTAHLVMSVKKLISIKVLVYVLLGTATIFAGVVLFWKLGSFLRQFTKGRVLQDGKALKTRYIKTWYGWVPQNQYNAQQMAWKRALGKPWRWFSWTDSNDDYSWVWWDPSCSAKEKHLYSHGFRRRLHKCLSRGRHQVGNSMKTVLRTDDETIRTSQILPARSFRNDKLDPFQVTDIESKTSLTTGNYTTAASMPSHSSNYLTYPFHPESPLLAPAKKGQCDHLSDLDGTPCRSRSSIRWTSIPNTDSCRVVAWRARRSPRNQEHIRSIVRHIRRVKHFREWAVRMQMGSLQSMIPHNSGLDGRPGSPMSVIFSRGRGQRSSLPECAVSEGTLHTIERVSSDSTQFLELQLTPCSVTIMNNNSRSLQRYRSAAPVSKQQQPPETVTYNTGQKGNPAKNLLDDELRFIDRLDRSLEWLLGECQPGRRGFSVPLLPKNWINRQAWVVYTTPCCASAELMRMYGDPGKTDDFTDRRGSQNKPPVILLHRRANTPRINSWRAYINKQRRRIGIEDVRAIEHWESSAEEPPDNVLDPSSWILRRPPQGFPMSTRQKNSYYDAGGGRWAKLENWQAIDRYEVDRGISAAISAWGKR